MATDVKRQLFIDAYLGDAKGNASQAAILAGYSAKTARQAGSRLLTIPDVKQAIQARQQALTGRADKTAEDVRRELETVAFTPVDGVRPSDKLKALELLGKEHGLFHDKRDKAGSGIVVNIGFLGLANGATVEVRHAHQDAADTSRSELPVIDVGMPPQAQVVLPGESL